MVALTVPVFTTRVEAAFDDYTHILYIEKVTDTNTFATFCVSNEPWDVFYAYRQSNTSTKGIVIGTAGTAYVNLDYSSSLNSIIGGSLVSPSDDGISFYIAYPNAYSSSNIKQLSYKFGSSASYASNISIFKVWTNDTWTSAEKNLVMYYSNDLTEIGITGGMTEEEILEIVNKSLNSTTATTTTANEIQSNLTTSYNGYQEGTVSADTLQSDVTAATEELNTLSESESNTLADLVAINNGLTYAQTVQDKLNADAIIDELQTDLKVSANVSSQITGKINEANSVYTSYTEGNITQSEAITQINQYITQLTKLITAETPQADIEAINAAVNTIANIRDSVNNYAELDKEVSEKSQASDEEELAYLDELTAETTSQLQDMSPEKEFSSQQITAGQSVFALIWENEIIKRIIPLAACFMVVCVVLGIRYKL